MRLLRILKAAGIFFLGTLIFAAAYNQSPLYTSNQHQYFLHGLAHAGVGLLSEDWLANTVDYTPLFSLLVEITTRLQAAQLFYVYYAALMGIYLFSLIGIIRQTSLVHNNGWAKGYLLTGIILFHSAALRFMLMRIPGAEWAYLFDGGFAGQRLLGPVFQPSVVGVFLLTSLFLHLRKKTIAAIVLAISTATVHPTYLLSAFTLTGIFLLQVYFVDKQPRKAFLTGLLAIVLVSPIFIYTYSQFTSGIPEIVSRAREIMVFIRIPHHALVEEWFDAASIIKLVLIGWGIYLVRGTRLFLCMLVPFILGIALTLIQIATGSLSLALIFPWRFSTWLVPISLVILLGKSATAIARIRSSTWKRILQLASLVLILIAVVTGMIRTRLEKLEALQAPSLPIEEYVASNRQPGDTYLIPTKLYTFRLNAGVSVYGDFFSVPLKSDEMIEWYGRFLNAKHFYEKEGCNLSKAMIDGGVTHVILPAEESPPCSNLLPIFTESAYHLYKIIP